MIGRTGVVCVLAASMFWLTGCGRGHEPGTDAAPGARGQQVTVHVPGMIDRQGIT
jgi:hypothetical protein